jgi:hypothetical protein
VAKSRKKPRKRTLAQRVEAVLARAMSDYADYCEEERSLGGSRGYPKDIPAFDCARQSILRLLREVARG